MSVFDKKVSDTTWGNVLGASLLYQIVTLPLFFMKLNDLDSELDKSYIRVGSNHKEWGLVPPDGWDKYKKYNKFISNVKPAKYEDIKQPERWPKWLFTHHLSHLSDGYEEKSGSGRTALFVFLLILAILALGVNRIFAA